MTAGLILFAHGARDPRWATPFEAVAERVRAQRPGLPVRLAFLELMRPSLLEAGAQLVAAGCTRITVLPLFLGAGGHVRKDLPLLVDELRATHSAVAFALQVPIGEDPRVIGVIADVAAASLSDAAA